MAAQVDVKATRGDTTRRFKLPLTPIPTWSALSALAKARHGIATTEQIALTYVDRQGKEVTFSSDEEVVDMWPRKPEGVDVQTYVDQLAPLSFKIIPLPKWHSAVEDVAESFEKVTIEEAKDTFSVKDATGPEVEVEPKKKEVKEQAPKEAEEAAQDPPEVPLADNQGPRDVPPVIAITRGIVDLLEIGLGRISMDPTSRAASNNVLEAVATVGLELDSLINTARRAGEGLLAAVAAERTQRQEENGQQTNEGPRGPSDETANARRAPSHTAAPAQENTPTPQRPPSPARESRTTPESVPFTCGFGRPSTFGAGWQRPTPYPVHPSAFARHAPPRCAETDPLAPRPRQDWGPSPFATRSAREEAGPHFQARMAAMHAAAMQASRARAAQSTYTHGPAPPTGPFSPPSDPRI